MGGVDQTVSRIEGVLEPCRQHQSVDFVCVLPGAPIVFFDFHFVYNSKQTNVDLQVDDGVGGPDEFRLRDGVGKGVWR